MMDVSGQREGTRHITNVNLHGWLKRRKGRRAHCGGWRGGEFGDLEENPIIW